MRIDIPFKLRPRNLQLELIQMDFLFNVMVFPHLKEARNSSFFLGLYGIFWNQNLASKTIYDFLAWCYIPCFQHVIILVEAYHQSLFFIGFQATAVIMLIISKSSQTLYDLRRSLNDLNYLSNTSSERT